MIVPRRLDNFYPPPEPGQYVVGARRALSTARTLGPPVAFTLGACALTTYGIVTSTWQLSVMSAMCSLLVALLGAALLLYTPHRSLTTRHDGITVAQRLVLLSVTLLPLTPAMLLLTVALIVGPQLTRVVPNADLSLHAAAQGLWQLVQRFAPQRLVGALAGLLFAALLDRDHAPVLSWLRVADHPPCPSILPRRPDASRAPPTLS